MFGASSDFIFSFKIQLCEDSRAYSLTVKCERRRIKISSYWWYLKSALISDVKESISSNSMEMRKAEKRGNLLCIHIQFYHLASSWVDFPWWLHFSVFLNLWKRSLEMRRKKKKRYRSNLELFCVSPPSHILGMFLSDHFSPLLHKCRSPCWKCLHISLYHNQLVLNSCHWKKKEVMRPRKKQLPFEVVSTHF